MRGKSNVIKRNVEKLWGVRYLPKNTVIWYGHVERMDPISLSNIMIHWEHEGRKKLNPSPKILERGDTPSHEGTSFF
jgi:hypothetical protein